MDPGRFDDDDEGEREDADLLRVALAVADGSSALDVGLSAETADRLSGPLKALGEIERLRSSLTQNIEHEPQLTPGAVFGDYEIGSLIASGGMGEVYRGRHRRLGRAVAIKTVGRRSRFDPQAVARFGREARLAASITHPNLVTLYEIGELDGRLCLIFELLKGETLSARLHRGPLPHDECSRLAEQVARGLGALHASGVTHSDIKPGNIFLCAGQEAKLIDMGISRPVERAADETRTRNSRFGTPAYMPPERIRTGVHSPAGDVFCLGVILYESLTGQHPFRRHDLDATLEAILHETPDFTGLPEGYTPLLKRCLEKDPDQRPGALAVAQGLAEIRQGRAPRLGGVTRARPWTWAAAATIVVIVGAAIGGLPGLAPPASKPRSPVTSPQASPAADVLRMYLDAQGLVDNASPDSFRRAKELYEQITVKAPDFAAGWASYANLLQMISVFVDGIDPAPTQARALVAANRALSLDPGTAIAQRTLADLLSQQNDWPGAERAIQRALQLSPERAENHYSYAVSVLAPTGRLDEAEREALRAIELQPLSGMFGEALGRVYYFKRDFAAALDQWTRVLVRHPRELASLWRKGQAETLLGRNADALKTFALADSFSPGITKGQALIAVARAQSGDLQGARAIRDRLLAGRQKGSYVSPTLLGVIEVGLGDADAAFPYLMAACAAHADWVRYAAVDPLMDPVRSDPRFRDLLRCLKLQNTKGAGLPTMPGGGLS